MKKKSPDISHFQKIKRNKKKFPNKNLMFHVKRDWDIKKLSNHINLNNIKFHVWCMWQIVNATESKKKKSKQEVRGSSHKLMWHKRHQSNKNSINIIECDKKPSPAAKWKCQKCWVRLTIITIITTTIIIIIRITTSLQIIYRPRPHQ